MKRTYSHNEEAHRKLKVAAHFDNPQVGDDVKAVQKAINRRIKNLKLDMKPLKVDGASGRQTVAHGRRVAHALGVGTKGDGLTVYVQKKIRHPESRTKAQIKSGQAWRKENITPPTSVSGNKVGGGINARERVVAGHMKAAHLYYTGQSHRFYSQPGSWTTKHGITGEPRGFRSDCSQYQTSIYWSADAPDPNGTNYTSGWTGSLAAHCVEITRMELEPGDLVIYFNGPNSHHVEGWVGNGDGKTSYAELAHQGHPNRDRTVGHGSPPVDYGDIDMIGGARFFRCPGL